MPKNPKSVELHLAARSELVDSVRFYGARSEETKIAFKQEVKEALLSIGEAPQRYPKFVGSKKDIRKFVLRKFPFAIFYIDRPKFVWVIAVAHAARRPGYWKDRLE